MLLLPSLCHLPSRWEHYRPEEEGFFSLRCARGGGGYLKGFDEGPEQGPDALPAAQQLDQAHDPEEAEEGDGDAGVLLCVLEAVGNMGW